MSGRVFLDTNIFVYDVDSSAGMDKKKIAEDLIRGALTKEGSVVSYQVVQEFLAVVTQKFSTQVKVADARRYLDTVFKRLLSVYPSVELFREALEIRSRYQLSWYDSLIVAAASEASCSVIYSEDLQHGAKIHGIRIENPFRAKRAN